MLRVPIQRALMRAGTTSRSSNAIRTTGTAAAPAKAPEKIEVFIDDKPVLVDPGTTILQVSMKRIIQQLRNHHPSTLPGCSSSRRRNPPVLLPRTSGRGRKLSHVSRRGGEDAEAGSCLCHARDERVAY